MFGQFVPFLLLISIFGITPSTSKSVDNEVQKNFKILVILPANRSEYEPLGLTLPEAKPVISQAIADAESSGLVPKDFLSIEYFDSELHVNPEKSEQRSTVRFFTNYVNNNLDGLLGLADSYAMATIAKVSGGLNKEVPIVTTAGQVSALGDKKLYPFITRLMGSYDQLADGLLSLLNLKGNSGSPSQDVADISFLFHDPRRGLNRRNTQTDSMISSACYFALYGIKTRLINANVQYQKKWELSTPSIPFDENEKYSPKDIQKWLKKLSFSSNTIIMCASSATVSRIMVEAHNLWMTSEHLFIHIDIAASSASTKQLVDVKQSPAVLSKIYGSLKTIKFRKHYGKKYWSILEKLSVAIESYELQKASSTRYPYNDFVLSLYDGILLYAFALSETLKEGAFGQKMFGLSSKMWKQNFEGIMGNISFNKNGDRFMEVSLFAYDQDGSKFVEAAFYSEAELGVHVLHPTLFFGSEPKKTIVCGWDQSLCYRVPPLKAILKSCAFIGLAGGLFAALLIFVKRGWALKKELKTLRLYHQASLIEAQENALKVWKKTHLVSSPLIKAMNP